MVVAGFLRVLASGALLLLATIATTPVQPAGAYSSYLTSTSGTGYTTGGTTGTPDALGTSDATTADGTTEGDDITDELIEECSTEISVCDDDNTCSLCVTASSNNEERLECHLFNTLTTSALGCEANMQAACCLDGLTKIECLENQAYLGYFGCILEALGCSPEVTCDDNVSDGTASDGATATTASVGRASTATVVIGFSCVFMNLYPLSWV